jgi:NADPH:quinone reductase-like Zn-dependent oxidoreductase
MDRQETTLPVSFNSLAIAQPGAPVSLQSKTITSLKKDEVLIRVQYASINAMDPKMAISNGFKLPTPYVLGFDFSGEVVRLGGKGRFEVGDQVFGSSITGGGFAEYIVAKKLFLNHRGAVPAPEASTYGIAYMTAYESMMLAGKAEKHKGKWIYIAGAAGGVGHFAVQLAKLSGLKVIGSAGKPASFDLLRQLNVDHVIDHSKQDVVKEIMKLTGGRGVDLVYDSTYNQASYDQSARVIAAGGMYIRLGTQAHMTQFGLEDMTPVVKGRGAKLVVGDQSRYGTNPLYMVRALSLLNGPKRAVSWYTEGKLKPLITQTVPFDANALQAAFDAFLKGMNNVGKVVVQCGRST